jgi:hypothetical protein
MTTLSTCWGFVINNPDDNDQLIVSNPNEQHIKQIVYTNEEASTPHIQGWIKLHRSQRMSFVKKLLPRANLKPCTTDEFTLNARTYCLKDDETTAGPHVITTNETMPDPVNFLMGVMTDWVDYHWDTLSEDETERADQLNRMEDNLYSQKECFRFLDQRERYLIEEKPWLVKLVLSPMYAKAKKTYWKEFLTNRLHTQDANDNEGQGTGESELHETKSTGSTSGEEEEDCEDCETITSSDSSSEPDSETE